MNVTFQEDFVAGDLKADLYIPEKYDKRNNFYD
jgi:hypothetical protein